MCYYIFGVFAPDTDILTRNNTMQNYFSRSNPQADARKRREEAMRVDSPYGGGDSMGENGEGEENVMKVP